MSVLVDTTAFYALVDADDANHERAVAAWRMIADEEAMLVTHNLVVVESIALVQARMGLAAVRDLVPFLESAETTWLGPDDHEVILAALLARDRRGVSFVDQASFHMMRKQGVRRALTFDRHFAREGFDLV